MQICNLNHRRQEKKQGRGKNRGKKCNEQKTTTKILDFNPSINILIIILNVNGLNTPVKRQRLSNWNFYQTQTILCLRKPTLNIDSDRLKVRRLRKIYHENTD